MWQNERLQQQNDYKQQVGHFAVGFMAPCQRLKNPTII
jgi:hypothetical protein